MSNIQKSNQISFIKIVNRYGTGCRCEGQAPYLKLPNARTKQALSLSLSLTLARQRLAEWTEFPWMEQEAPCGAQTV